MTPQSLRWDKPFDVGSVIRAVYWGWSWEGVCVCVCVGGGGGASQRSIQYVTLEPNKFICKFCI